MNIKNSNFFMKILHKRLAYGTLVFCLASAFYFIQCRQKTDDNKSATSAASPIITAPQDAVKLPAPTGKVDTAKPRHGLVLRNVTLPLDTLFVEVDSNGITYLGEEKMDADFLRRRLADSLLILKKQSGQYPKKIKLRTRGDVLMGVRGEIQDAIQEVKDSLKIK